MYIYINLYGSLPQVGTCEKTQIFEYFRNSEYLFIFRGVKIICTKRTLDYKTLYYCNSTMIFIKIRQL